MPLRRMLLFATALLLVGAIVSAVAQRDDRPSAPARTAPAVAGAAGGPRRIEATLPADSPVRARVGDVVHLSVKAPGPEQIDIPGLGLSEPADAQTPAVVDFVAPAKGSYDVNLSLANTKVGVVEVQPAR
jgi:hypothetical protein